MQDAYNQLESKGEPFSALNVKSKLQGVGDEKGVLEVLADIIKGIEARVGNDYSKGTLNHYKTTQIYARIIDAKISSYMKGLEQKLG